jgi:hypothetical protein
VAAFAVGRGGEVMDLQGVCNVCGASLYDWSTWELVRTIGGGHAKLCHACYALAARVQYAFVFLDGVLRAVPADGSDCLQSPEQLERLGCKHPPLGGLRASSREGC